MQHGPVCLIADGGKDLVLAAAGRRAENGERLIAVAGHDDLIEKLAAARVGHAQTGRFARNGVDRAGQADIVQLGCDPPDVFTAAAFDRAPLRTIEYLQQTMVLAEADEGGEWHFAHLSGRAGPDRGTHRQQVPFGKGYRVISFAQEILQAALVVGVIGQPIRTFTVEAQNVGQHGPERTADQIAFLTENRRQIAARPFQRRILEADREGHLGFDAFDAEQRKKRDQVGVGLFIENEKTGINRMRLAVQRHIDRVGVTAEIGTGFEDGDVMVTRQQPGGRESGDTGTDDGDSAFLD